MPKISYKFLLIILIVSINFSACKNKKQQQKAQVQKQEIKNDTSLGPTVLFKFKNKIFGIPSPVLVSQVVKKMNLPYESSLINSTDNATSYISTFKKAINLGVYSADLGYLTIYKQNNLLTDYYKVVKQLAEELDLLNVINQVTINRLEQNDENPDSLLYLISTAFRDIDVYLNENDLQKIGALILAGGWIESEYLLTQLYYKHPSKQLIQKIGEQKSPLANLLHILEPYYNKNDRDLDHLFESLAEISSLYDAIIIKYQYDKPEIYPDKHLTVIHSKTIININDIDLQKISKKTAQLRNWITK